jgi:hypothetical protein
MNRFALVLSISLLASVFLPQISYAQSKSLDSLVSDTTIIDEKQSWFGMNINSPQSTLKPEEYSRLINTHFAASPILKKNNQYMKVVIATITEKDGSVSSYIVKGVGPSVMKEELVRILKLLPNNTPATKDGKPIRYRSYQPFEFSYSSL